MSKYKDMSDDYLKRTYVPDVYQKTIYAINYDKLREAGIKCLTFDINDTIVGSEQAWLSLKIPKVAVKLFADLKAADFITVLVTNSGKGRAKRFCDKLSADGYISKAKKPRTDAFQAVQDMFGLEKSQLAHIGNKLLNDVAGGNTYGVMTCLVRDVGHVAGIRRIAGKYVPGISRTEDQKLRKELKHRNIWRKNHKHDSNDQYYQLGETPRYTQLLQ